MQTRPRNVFCHHVFSRHAKRNESRANTLSQGCEEGEWESGRKRERQTYKKTGITTENTYKNDKNKEIKRQKHRKQRNRYTKKENKEKKIKQKHRKQRNTYTKQENKEEKSKTKKAQCTLQIFFTFITRKLDS